MNLINILDTLFNMLTIVQFHTDIFLILLYQHVNVTHELTNEMSRFSFHYLSDFNHYFLSFAVCYRSISNKKMRKAGKLFSKN